jgi:hypothetical protein
MTRDISSSSTAFNSATLDLPPTAGYVGPVLLASISLDVIPWLGVERCRGRGRGLVGVRHVVLRVGVSVLLVIILGEVP